MVNIYTLLSRHLSVSSIAASSHVALNPVRARLVARADDWPWSSVRAHLAGKNDALATVRPLLDRIESAGSN